MDVSAHGYGRVLVNGMMLGICFLSAAFGLVLVGNRRARTDGATVLSFEAASA